MARRTASSILVLPAITVGASFHKQSSPSSGEHYEQSDPWPQPGGLRPGWVSHLASGAGDRACIRWDQATTRPASAGCPDDGYGSTHRRSGNDIELSNPGLRCLDGQSGGESPIPLLSGCTPPPLGTEARVTTSGTTPETRRTWAPRPGPASTTAPGPPAASATRTDGARRRRHHELVSRLRDWAASGVSRSFRIL
jgi:hypothetical protein